jgi:hypothetical protein
MAYLHNDREQFKDAIYLAYDQTGIMVQAIEKDYYVTMLLKLLSEKILLRSQKVSRKILALLFRLLQRAGGQFKSCPRYKNGIYSIGSCESGNAGEKIHNLAVCRC